MKIIKVKKLIFFAVIFIFVFSAILYRYIMSSKKYKDINYAVENYMTTGLFNKNKLYKVDDARLNFSDGVSAVMSVSGVQNKSPHKNMKYDVFLEKNKKGIWKVKKVYPQ